MVVNWTDTEVFQLISCWAEEGIQEELEGFKRNKHIYERLSRSLAKHNIEKMSEQCHTKVKKLCQEHKDERQAKSNRLQKKWMEIRYQTRWDTGCTDLNSPPVLLETLDPQPILSDYDSDEADVEEVQKGSV